MNLVRLSILFLSVFLSQATGFATESSDAPVYRVDSNLIRLTFSEMLMIGYVDRPSEAKSNTTQRNQNRSARHYILARESSLAGKNAEAERLYRIATSIDPGNLAAWEELGDLCFEQGRQREAADAWNAALEQQDDADLLLKCGLLEYELELLKRASEHLMRRRLLLDDDLPVNHETILQNAAMSEALKRLGNRGLVKAVRLEIESLLVQLALRSSSDVGNGKSWMRLVQNLTAIGDIRSARDAARLRLEHGSLEGEYGPWISSNMKTRFILLDALMGGSGEEVIQLIELLDEKECLRGLPPDWRKDATLTSVLYEAAVDYATVGNQPGANLLFAEVLIHDPDHLLARNNLGYAAMESGMINRPLVEMLEAALVDARASESEALFQILDTVGWLRYMQGHYESDDYAVGAIEFLEEAASSSTGEPDPVILDHLGDALWMANRRDEAVDAWMAALRRLNEPEFKQITMRDMGMLQGMIWQFRVVDSRDLYDREYGAVLASLVEKLSAVEQGAPPEVAERIMFIK